MALQIIPLIWKAIASNEESFARIGKLVRVENKSTKKPG